MSADSTSLASPAGKTGPAGPTEEAVLELRDLFKIYREGEIETVALRGVTLQIAAGEFVVIVGRSGSGKSTLLGLAAGLSLPSAGKVVIEGQDIARLSETGRAELRQRRVGLVFQNNNLIPFLSVLENIEVVIKQRKAGGGRSATRATATALLEQVGLAKRLHHLPAQLSGGEQQRAAIAIALVNEPALLLADEPTGELDAVSAAAIMELLVQLNQQRGVAIVIVTHNAALAGLAGRRVQMADGLLTPLETLPANAVIATSPTTAASPNGKVNTLPAVLQASGLTKSYPNGVAAVRGVSLAVQAGESLALMGPSGCGKSTLLNLVGGLDKPTTGSVRLGETVFEKLSQEKLAILRRREIGFIFQSHNLIATLSALENVGLPLVLDGVPPQEWENRAEKLLELVGLADHLAKTPDQLSGGQRQRVAIARSLAHHPRLLLADEPTGSLDADTARQIIGLLGEVAHSQQVALVVVTHDPLIAAYCDRILYMEDGQLLSAVSSDVDRQPGPVETRRLGQSETEGKTDEQF